MAIAIVSSSKRSKAISSEWLLRREFAMFVKHHRDSSTGERLKAISISSLFYATAFRHPDGP
jgi:hypothetical protein